MKWWWRCLWGGCFHKDYTFPQSHYDPRGRRHTHVACLGCGQRLNYSWEEMKIVEPETNPDTVSWRLARL